MNCTTMHVLQPPLVSKKPIGMFELSPRQGHQTLRTHCNPKPLGPCKSPKVPGCSRKFLINELHYDSNAPCNLIQRGNCNTGHLTTNRRAVSHRTATRNVAGDPCEANRFLSYEGHLPVNQCYSASYHVQRFLMCSS